MSKRISDYNPSLLQINHTSYRITPQIRQELEAGKLPEELMKQIRKNEGEETAYEFGRKIRLQKKVNDQIESGELPPSLSLMVRQGKVPTEILQPLSTHKLQAKSEQLFQKGLLTEADICQIRDSTLTEEVIPSLSKALLLNVAEYLHSQKEISQETLDGFRNGSIDLSFVKVLRRHYRKMQYGDEVSEKFHIHPQSQEDFNNPFFENLSDQHYTIEGLLIRQTILHKLDEAMTWLSPEEKLLIRQIYEDGTPLTSIARNHQVDEKTIRYRRDCILRKLRFILETFLQLDVSDLYF